ncbi:hypothetical protein L873DRAFT_149483 [Choiromyces venosus 120613-1]|uniref:Uncharacterized protein n=1 Tax=Choiromyces venosus 120613-1 TaxID=1336337 RepID=A0A3N4JFU9_9PEZI|nr:hypothetical protein L873DRAFT_149483 [Choiromyces venosus 120613-1]
MILFDFCQCLLLQTLYVNLKNVILTFIHYTLSTRGPQIVEVVLSTFQSYLCLLNLFAQMSFLFLQLRACFLIFGDQGFKVLASLFSCALLTLCLLCKEFPNILMMNPSFTMNLFLIHLSLTSNSVITC